MIRLVLLGRTGVRRLGALGVRVETAEPDRFASTVELARVSELLVFRFRASPHRGTLDLGSSGSPRSDALFAFSATQGRIVGARKATPFDPPLGAVQLLRGGAALGYTTAGRFDAIGVVFPTGAASLGSPDGFDVAVREPGPLPTALVSALTVALRRPADGARMASVLRDGLTTLVSGIIAEALEGRR